MAREDGLLTGCWPSTDSPYLTLAGTWDEYLAELDRKHRSNVRNRLNRLRKKGRVEMEVISRGADLGRSLQVGLDIEAKAWKGVAGTAIVRHPALLDFYRVLAKRTADRGWLRLSFLNVDGRPVAFDYSLEYANRLYVLKPGYDPEFAPYSPYNLLTCLKLQDAFQSGLIEYDFLGMKDDWKLSWTRATRPHCWLFIFSDELRGKLLHYAKFRLTPELRRHRLFRMLQSAGARMFNPEFSGQLQ
jgi:CelD/BcsL family acetyltransferase involved in cellulose biosynthesis